MEGCAGIVTVVSKERGDLGGGVLCIIICELRNREEVGPVVLVIICVKSQISLNLLVRPLRLTVGLRVISCGIIQLNIQKSAERRHELGGQGGTSVRHYVGRNTMLRENVLDV